MGVGRENQDTTSYRRVGNGWNLARVPIQD
jgi:hypothetical protein